MITNDNLLTSPVTGVVLTVEYDARYQKQLRDLPTVHGRSVTEVENGQVMLKTIISFSRDVVAMDVVSETSASQAQQGAKRLRKVVEARPIQVNREKGQFKNHKVTISIGIAEYPGNAGCGDALIETVDHAFSGEAPGVLLCSLLPRGVSKRSHQNDHRSNSSLADRGRSG
jgi:hypothetical protein